MLNFCLRCHFSLIHMEKRVLFVFNQNMQYTVLINNSNTVESTKKHLMPFLSSLDNLLQDKHIFSKKSVENNKTCSISVCGATPP